MDLDVGGEDPPQQQRFWLSQLLSDWLTSLTNRCAAAARAAVPVAAWLAKVGSFLGTALLLASAIYLFLYYTLIGEEVVSRRLYFTFDSACKLKLEPAATGLPEDLACGFPVANVSLAPNRDEVGELVYGQAYRVSVRLWLPDSRPNRLAGMFLIRLQLYSPGFEPGTSAIRPALLPHRPWAARLFGDLTAAAFGLLIGWDAEPRQLSVDLLDDYVENPFIRSSGLLVELQSRRVQVQRAVVEFRARLSGLKYMMYSYPLISACLGIPAIAWLLLLVSAPVLLRRWLSGGGEEADADWLDGDGGDGGPQPMPLLDPTRHEAAAAYGGGGGGGGEARRRRADGDGDGCN
ncbi:hypothetical protein BOX15_Mlig009852g1 [Macrostomum lignano]|uniref:Seipin n=3 Tax=Macrostomum lignano TaxID=282301 RepID=A0A1I8II49_9PLAT|nr:hypothetical protein BOX15_Mlig009852g1 [Macrostomum lignano]